MNTTYYLVIAALTFALYVVWLVRFIGLDGHGRRAGSCLPRSHHSDAFEAHDFLR